MISGGLKYARCNVLNQGVCVCVSVCVSVHAYVRACIDQALKQMKGRSLVKVVVYFRGIHRLLSQSNI